MDALPQLHVSRSLKSAAILRRTHAFLHAFALSSFLYHRAVSLPYAAKPPATLLILASELLLAFLWLLNRSFLWRPTSRAVFPERLPPDAQLPAIDVLVCTADPWREPALGVMNTLISAMAMDYPPEKLTVYLSDDAASPLTLYAVREAWSFARSWVAFCRAHGIKRRCPDAYFSSVEFHGGRDPWGAGLSAAKAAIKVEYEAFKKNLRTAEEDASRTSGQFHPATVQVMGEDGDGGADMPLLVYVCREKRSSHPHHFKAGALNALLRVSGIISNAPCILVLDCDMFANDPTSARQAMCFFLDPNLSPSLAFVQFPQKFHNFSKNDIYCAELRQVFVIKWPGMDGLKGPVLSGTCFYVKREALYGFAAGKRKDVPRLKDLFGPSNEFLNSLSQGCRRRAIPTGDSAAAILSDAERSAACAYEEETEWGQKVGFLYHSLLEDYFTSFTLHLRGWRSVYCDPRTPAFLGTATTNLNDTLVQSTRWSAGAVEVAFSRFCPLFYGPWKMPFLQRMCYVHIALQPLTWFPLWCLAIIPQLCLLKGIPTYPNASSSWFLLLCFVSLSSLLEHLAEVIFTGGCLRMWWNELRFWMIKAVTANFWGTLDVVLKWIGVKEANFSPTNKVVDDEQIKQYQMGLFDFQTSTMLLAPLTTMIILNTVALVGGLVRVMNTGRWDELLGQILLPLFILFVNYPIIEGMIMRRDNGRVPPSTTLLSILYCATVLFIGFFALM